MNPKLRRDRNAFLVFLAAVPFALLIALPLAVTNGKIYMAAKAAKEMRHSGSGMQESGTGASAAPKTQE